MTKALDTLTISSYISDLTQLEDATQKVLTKLDTTDVLAFLASFENKRTLNRKLSSINAFFAFCHKQDFVHEKIKIPMAKVPKNLPKYV
ncbi:site-specific integrase, partial [Sulfurimonas sp.]|uniref:site-specific integrase n=1 Tax=Sulfurimonas sp. TaxID=2022749 RepID=UPI002634BC37